MYTCIPLRNPFFHSPNVAEESRFTFLTLLDNALKIDI